jgi:hypothetical protein
MIFVGVDWSEDHHDIDVRNVDAGGTRPTRGLPTTASAVMPTTPPCSITDPHHGTPQASPPGALRTQAATSPIYHAVLV